MVKKKKRKSGNQGFASSNYDPAIKYAAQSKGGSAKNPKKGFGSMNPVKRREVAAMGGKS